MQNNWQQQQQQAFPGQQQPNQPQNQQQQWNNNQINYQNQPYQPPFMPQQQQQQQQAMPGQNWNGYNNPQYQYNNQQQVPPQQQQLQQQPQQQQEKKKKGGITGFFGNIVDSVKKGIDGINESSRQLDFKHNEKRLLIDDAFLSSTTDTTQIQRKLFDNNLAISGDQALFVIQRLTFDKDKVYFIENIHSRIKFMNTLHVVSFIQNVNDTEHQVRMLKATMYHTVTPLSDQDKLYLQGSMSTAEGKQKAVKILKIN